jgi:hypothetical protein
MSVDYEEFFDKISLGADIPVVEVSDLESVWRLRTLNLDLEILAERCSPGANVLAVLLRAACLEAAYTDRCLAQFENDLLLHNSALQVIATVPLNTARLQDVPWLVERISETSPHP